MKKTLLLTATAFAALGFAGAANAQDAEVTGAVLSGQTVYTNSLGSMSSTPYPVASETISSNATRVTSGANTVSVALPDGLQPGVQYTFIQSYTGAQFSVNSSSLTFGAGVADCVAIGRTGGTANSSSVTYTVTAAAAAGGTCDAAEFAALAGPLTAVYSSAQIRANAIAAVGTTVSGAVSTGNTVIGADDRATFSETLALAAVVNGFEARIDAAIGGGAGSDTRLSLTPEPAYTTLSGDTLIGNVGYDAAVLTGFSSTEAFVGFSAAALPTVESDVVLTISGSDFETIVPVNFTVDADDNTVASRAQTTFEDVEVDVAPGLAEAAANGTVTFSVEVTPTDATGPTATAVNLSEAFSGALESIELQGTTFIAPWVQSTNPNYNTVIRLSNNGTRATGAVRLGIASPLRGVSQSTCDLAGVPANGELSINSAQLTTCFGDFGRGDVTITVLSVGDDLTAKLRIVNPGNVVSEQSLNRTSGAPIQ